MREVKIEELEVGDEIVIACQAYFKYLRVLVKPSIGKHVHWSTKRPMYRSVKCSTRRDIVDVGNGYTRTQWIFTPEDHNTNQYIDLECRQVLLVNRP